MQTFLDNFHKGGELSARIARHQTELRREGKFIDQKLLFISAVQIDHLNLGNSVRNHERENFLNQGTVTV